jgi:hypothetical protein
MVLEFDADGLATCDDPAVLAVARKFPKTFTIRETAPPPTAEPRPQGYRQETLQTMTVANLRALPITDSIPGASRLTKADLIAAILSAQEG